MSNDSFEIRIGGRKIKMILNRPIISSGANIKILITGSRKTCLESFL
jgi:hypothetical protein